MSKQKKLFRTHHYVTYDDGRPAEDYDVLIEFSDPEKIFQSAIAAIQHNDAEALEACLKESFIYPGNGLLDHNIERWGGDEGFIFTRDIDPYHTIYYGNYHTRHMTNAWYYARPAIEALFFEHNRLFQELVFQAATSPSFDVHRVLLSARENTDIPIDVFHIWDYEKGPLVEKIISKINEMQCYGDYLTKKGINRGAQITAIASKLDDLLKKFLPNLPDTNIPNMNKLSQLIQWANFKFLLLKTLHSRDAYIIAHRDLGFKKIISNLASIIFSAGILNILNYCFTGHFLFFNHSTSYGLVSALDQPLQYQKIVPYSEEIAKQEEQLREEVVIQVSKASPPFGENKNLLNLTLFYADIKTREQAHDAENTINNSKIKINVSTL